MIGFLIFYWLFSFFVLLGIYLANNEEDVTLGSIMSWLLFAGLLFPVLLGGLIARIFDKMDE